MNKKSYFSVSTKNFEKVNSEFTKCSISIMGYNEIANGTKFSKENILNACPTLNYVPVIGYWDDKDEDFSDHGIEYVISNDGIEENIKTTPFGVVIKDSYRFDTITMDNGEEVEYLFADCYLWNRNEKAINKVKEGKCNQSMEISISDYVERDNYIDITNFEFTALCILGENVTPAFSNARIKQAGKYSKDDFKAIYSEMISKFEEAMKGGNIVSICSKCGKEENEDLKFEEIDGELLCPECINAQFEGEDSDDSEDSSEGDNTEENTDDGVEPLADDGQQEENQDDEVEDVIVDDDESTTQSKAKKKMSLDNENMVIKYELSFDDISYKLCEKLYGMNPEYYYYLVNVYDDRFIYQREYYNEMSNGYVSQLFKQQYSKVEGRDEVVFVGDPIEMFVEYLTADEVRKLSEIRTGYEKLSNDLKELEVKYNNAITELEDLRAYKQNIIDTEHKEEVDLMLQGYSVLANLEGYNEIVEDKYNKDINEMERDLKVLAFDNDIRLDKKPQTKKKFEKDSQAKIPVVGTKAPAPLTAWSILDKYIKDND
ncbi:MAG: hypothetical protein ACI3T9_06155 [Romboutsia timonensis]